MRVKKSKVFYIVLVTTGVLSMVISEIVKAADPLDRYNVVWDSPGENSAGSMPIGNGDIGLNVWVEEGGDLVFYVAKNDSWSENGRLLKLGRVRVKLSPNSFKSGLPFKQELKLRQGHIEITAGEKGSEVTIKVWVDAHNPVVRFEAEGKDEFEMQVNFETWRETGYKLKSTTPSDMLNFDNGSSRTVIENDPYPTIVYPDVIVPGKKDRIIWYHHNVKSLCGLIMKVQGLESYYRTMTDPLLYRTFGGAIQGKGFESVIKRGVFNGPDRQYPTKMMAYSDRELKSAQPSTKHSFNVYTLTRHPITVPEYMNELDELIAEVDAIDIEDARRAHQQWWDDFWNLSWIRITGNDEIEEVAKAYTLQRYIYACNSRGTYPIKFNGFMFTVENTEGDNDPDWRIWGPGFWFMNTRAMYWPMLTSGDFDLMEPYFNLYMNALPIAKERNRIYFGHAGIHFPEQLYFWGGYPTDHYGWDRTGRDFSEVECKWTARLWQGGLELVLIMLDYYGHTQDKEFLKNKLLVIADEVTAFYDLHYRRDDKGKLYIWPAQSLETWWDCVNPMPEVAGLRFVLDKLLKLPEQYTSSAQRKKWERLLSEVPEIPTRTLDDGRIILAPAEKFAIKGNRENCELFSVFPYRIYGVRKPNLEMAQLTLKNPFKNNWNNGVYMAYLGLVDLAQDYIVSRAWRSPVYVTPAAGMRFRYLNTEQFPDAYMSMLQAMLLQYEDEKIVLFPTWPKEWDVDFKLHAPYNTTIEGIYSNGKLEHLKVTPEPRAKDVIKMQPQ
ncbi:DUF5703 domain-containing protein [Planctomycetota bacterium]